MMKKILFLMIFLTIWAGTFHAQTNQPTLVAGVNAAAYNSFADAITAANATNQESVRVIVSTAMPVSSNVVINPKIITQFTDAGRLTVGSGGNVNFTTSKIEAGAYQIFQIIGNGTINIQSAKADKFYFEWKGTPAGADNTAAMQWLIDQRRAGAATNSTRIFVGERVYNYTYLDFSNAYRITLESNTNSGYDPKSELRCTSVGQTETWYADQVNDAGQSIEVNFPPTCMRLGSVYGFNATGIKFSYSNKNFEGYLIRGGRGVNGGGADAHYVNFLHCNFTGTFDSTDADSAYKALAFIYVGEAVSWSIKNSQFRFAKKGIISSEAGLPGQSNIVAITNNNLFIDLGIAIYNVSYNWTITENTFESVTLLENWLYPDPGTRPSPYNRPVAGWGESNRYRFGDLRALGGDIGRSNWHLSFKDNWVGDIVSTDSVYAVMNLEGVLGANITGNTFNWEFSKEFAGSVAVFNLNNCDGINIVGNSARVFNKVFTVGNVPPQAIMWAANIFDTNEKMPEVGQIFQETRLSNRLTSNDATDTDPRANKIGNGLTVFGSAGTNQPNADVRSITFGTINNAATLANSPGGAAIRTTSNVKGFSDGSLITQGKGTDGFWDNCTVWDDTTQFWMGAVFCAGGRGTRIGNEGTRIGELRHGTAAMISGTVKISDPRIRINTLIFVNNEGIFAGKLNVTKTAFTGFTVTSTNVNDAGTIVYMIVQPGS